MASKIRIFRSTGATAPASLEYGELAVTIESGTPGSQANKAGRLFVGNASGNPVELGGEYTYKLMDHEHGVLTNSSVAIVGTTGQIDGWKVAGILTATRTDITDLVAQNLNITGVSTFAGGFNLNGNVTIGDSHTDILTINSRTGFNTDATFNQKLLVSGISTFTGDSTFSNNVLISGVSTHTGASIFNGTLTANGNVTIGDAHTDTLTINSRTGFNTDATFNQKLLVTGISTFTGDSTFSNNVLITGVSTHTGNSSFNGNTTIGDAHTDTLTVNARTGFNTDATFNQKVLVTGISTFTGDSTFSNNVLITGVSTHTGASTFSNNLTVNGTTTLNGNTTIGDAHTDTLTVNSRTGFNTDATFNQKLLVTGISTFTGQVKLGGGTGYTLPTVDGFANQVLTTNGSGTVSFQEVSSTLVISAGAAGTDGIDLRTETFTIAPTLNQTKTTLSNNTITVGLATDIIVGGGMTVTNNLLVLGDLTVQGTETILNVERLDVQDKTVGVASTSTASNTTADGGGFFVHGGSDGNKEILWSLTNSGFTVNQSWMPSTNNARDLGSASLQWRNIFVDGLAELDDVNVSAAATIATLNVTGTGTLATVDINGGNIDATVVGAAVTAAGTFTTLTAGTIVTGGRLDAGEVTFNTLRVTGVSTLASLILSSGTNTNGVAYFNSSGQLQSTVTPGSGISTSTYILTSLGAASAPTWTDTIDGGTF